jgi:hypothetical protein
MPDHLGYVAAGYLITAVALGGYWVRLLLRARRAGERAAAARRAGGIR